MTTDKVFYHDEKYNNSLLNEKIFSFLVLEERLAMD